MILLKESILIHLTRKTLKQWQLPEHLTVFTSIIRAQYFSLDTKGSSFIESLIRYGNNAKTVKNSSQQSLFGDTGGFDMVKPEPSYAPTGQNLKSSTGKKR